MRVLLMSCVVAFGACAPTLQGPLDVSGSPEAAATLGHGYGLLMPMLQNEASATLIFGVKPASEELQAVVRRVSDASANAQRTLRTLLAAPPPIDSKHDGLPLIEVSTRNLMTNEEAAGLLLAGSPFECRMILAQQKACAYIAALSDTLSKADPNADRAAVLAAMATEFRAFEKELRGMLSVAQPSSSSKAS